MMGFLPIGSVVWNLIPIDQDHCLRLRQGGMMEKKHWGGSLQPTILESIEICKRHDVDLGEAQVWPAAKAFLKLEQRIKDLETENRALRDFLPGTVELNMVDGKPVLRIGIEYTDSSIEEVAPPWTG